MVGESLEFIFGGSFDDVVQPGPDLEGQRAATDRAGLQKMVVRGGQVHVIPGLDQKGHSPCARGEYSLRSIGLLIVGAGDTNSATGLSKRLIDRFQAVSDPFTHQGESGLQLVSHRSSAFSSLWWPPFWGLEIHRGLTDQVGFSTLHSLEPLHRVLLQLPCHSIRIGGEIESRVGLAMLDDLAHHGIEPHMGIALPSRLGLTEHESVGWQPVSMF